MSFRNKADLFPLKKLTFLALYRTVLEMSTKRCINVLMTYAKAGELAVPHTELQKTVNRILTKGVPDTLIYLTEQLYYTERHSNYYVVEKSRLHEYIDERHVYIKKLESELAELKNVAKKTKDKKGDTLLK